MKTIWQKFWKRIVICSSIIIMLALSIIGNDFFSSLLLLKPSVPNHDSMQLHIVDVGQGSATLIRFSSGETMLIDSGDSSNRSKLINYINNIFFNGTQRHFNYVILTHSDSDHSGNMKYIIDHYSIDSFYRPNILSTVAGEAGIGYEDDSVEYGALITTLNSKNINVVTNFEGVSISNGNNTLLNMYSPRKETYDNTNDYSPIMILGDEFKVCITGDASSNIEKQVAEELPDVDVLVAGHHGSETSTSMQLMEATLPEYVAVSVGVNTYGHPSSQLYDTLAEYDYIYNKSTMQTKMLTLDYGNIMYYMENNNIEIATIKNVNDYLFVDYYVFVVGACLILAAVIVVPIIKDKKGEENN